MALHGNRLTKVETRLAVLIWIVGMNVAFTLAAVFLLLWRAY